MANVIVGLIVVIVVVSAARKAYRGMCGGGCCGEGVAKRVKVSDKNEKNYSYELEMNVGGMSCQNCAIRVENALNKLEGAWATVDLKNNKAHLRLKDKLPDEKIIEVVHDAGYTVSDIHPC